jgi:L-malate glycosyltransferase
MKKLNVLFMPSWFPDKKNPKHGIYFKEQAKQLNKFANINILALQRIPIKNFIKFISFNKSNIIKNSDLQPPTYHLAYIDWAINMIDKKIMLYKKNLLKYYKRFIRFKPDIIHAHGTYPAGYGAYILSSKYKIPFIITEHASHFEETMMGDSYRKYSKEVLKYANYYTAVSNVVKEKIIKFDRSQCEVLSNFINYDKFDIKVEKNFWKYKNKFNLINISDIEHLKGIDILLKALERTIYYYNNKDVFLHIIGDGIQLDEYKKLSKNLKVEDYCKFYGLIDNDKLPKILNSCNVLVISSRAETFGIVGIEAMACGLPIVSTDCGGPSTYINKTTGLIVKNEDPDKLAEGIIKIKNNFNKYNKSLIKNICKKNYSSDSICSKILKIYEKTIKNSKKS